MDRVPKNGLGVPDAFKKRVKSTNKNPTHVTSKRQLTDSVLTLGEAVLAAVTGVVVGTFWFEPGPFFGEVTT